MTETVAFPTLLKLTPAAAVVPPLTCDPLFTSQLYVYPEIPETEYGIALAAFAQMESGPLIDEGCCAGCTLIVYTTFVVFAGHPLSDTIAVN